jgi:hypothetical protein
LVGPSIWVSVVRRKVERMSPLTFWSI